MSTRRDEPDVPTSCAVALVDEWARAGLTDAVVAPGSRSTPLALAFARDGRIRVHVVIDERSAAFRALGIARAQERPVAVLCTSGTAAANFTPAVVEAHHGRVPLLVCTANRPPALQDTGAPQTIDQTHLYGRAARWFVPLGPPPAGVPGVAAVATWRSVAIRSWSEAVSRPAGPVHLDLAFAEPLLPSGGPLVDAPGRPGGEPWVRSVIAGTGGPDAATVDRLAAAVRDAPRGLVVAGWGAGASAGNVARFAVAAGWPVVADPISGLRVPPVAVSCAEALVRAGFGGRHRPDLVLRLGAAPTSRVVTEWLDATVPQLLVDPDRAWADPERAVRERLEVDPDVLLARLAAALGTGREGPPGAGGEDPHGAWWRSWIDADARVRAAIDARLDAWADPFDGRVARDVAAALPDGATLAVASSMPVRDLDWFMAPRPGLHVVANRGANGIDGFTSTVLGVASARPGPTVALLGDLAFLHDTNGLVGAAPAGVDAVLVVLDNDGGGIFSLLPQAPLPEFEMLFATPHGLDLVAVARSHGVGAVRVERATEVVPAVRDAIDRRGVQVVVVPSDRSVSARRHRELWDVAAGALGDATA